MCKKVEACFEVLENPFTILNSEYKRSKFFPGKCETVEPVECVIGSRFDKGKLKRLEHMIRQLFCCILVFISI